MFVQEEFSIFLNSNEQTGAMNKSKDGSEFTISLKEPITIPKSARKLKISVENSHIWNTSHNILDGINNKMYISIVESEGDPSQPYDITIPPGLYDVFFLYEQLKILYQAEHGETLPFTIIPDDSNQTVIFQKLEDANVHSITIDFTQTDTLRDLLGFDDRVVELDDDNLVERGDKKAEFNVNDSFLICCSISNGMLVNDQYANVIANIPIDVKPGRAIIYAPYNPIKIECENLIGETIRSIRVWLRNQDLQPVNTGGENYRVLIKFSYYEKID